MSDDSARMREIRERAEAGVCDWCGTTNGIHKLLTREDGKTAACSGGDAAVLATKLAALESQLAEALRWDDAPQPEDDAIEAAHPARTGKHETWGEAMRLVGARRSKGSLVGLVNWLLAARALSAAAGGKSKGDADSTIRTRDSDVMAVLRDLVAALRLHLPAVCEQNECDDLAMWHFPGTSHRYCDEHGPGSPTALPYAPQLRAAVALLEGRK